MNPLLIMGYEPLLQPNGIDYKFITDAQVVYDAIFAPADEFFPENSFAANTSMFILGLEQGAQPSPREDKKIGQTVVSIFDQHFSKNRDSVICYICANEDKKELLRLRKFSWLFENNNPNRNNNYIKINIVDKEQGVYGAIIYHRDNIAAMEINEAATHFLE